MAMGPEAGPPCCSRAMSFLDTVPAAIQRLDGRGPWARFRVTDPRQRVAVLREVVRGDVPLTLGVGAGQMSRVDSARIAAIKAANAGLVLEGSAVASDAFFPFRDGLDVVIDQGACCVIQPGGSMRDVEVFAAADERGIAMVVTGTRHFRH